MNREAGSRENCVGRYLSLPTFGPFGKDSYFCGVLAVLVEPVVLVLCFVEVFLAFFVGVVLFWSGVVWPGAAGVDWAANVSGRLAAAKTIASKLFFMLISPCGTLCPVYSIFRQCQFEYDRLEGLTRARKDIPESANHSLHWAARLAPIRDIRTACLSAIIDMEHREGTFICACPSHHSPQAVARPDRRLQPGDRPAAGQRLHRCRQYSHHQRERRPLGRGAAVHQPSARRGAPPASQPQ